MDQRNPNSPNNSYDQRPSRAPLFLTLFVLGALAIVAIVAITPKNNTPLTTNDQVSPAAGDVTASPSTTPSTTSPAIVDGGAVGDGDVQPNTESDPSADAQNTDTSNQPLPETDGAGGTVAP